MQVDSHTMRIAYVLTEFPALSETFVATECTLLERAGATILPFSFRPPHHRELFSTDLSRWDRRTHRPSPAALGPLLRYAAQHPGRLRNALSILARYRAADGRERLP